MNYYDLSGLSVHKMQIMVSAAEHKSFKAAASYLHVTQSMISKTIASLESELDIQLFVRSQDGIRLTAAGQYLYEAWSLQLKGILSSVEKARQIQSGSVFQLRIGSLKSIPTEYYMDDAARLFGQNNQEVTIQLEQTTLEDLFLQLLNGSLDIIYTESMERDALLAEGCCCETVIHGFLTVCMHESNPLYQKEEISILDLKDEPQILLDRKTAENFNQFILNTCQAYGFTPMIRAFAPNTHTASQYVRLGTGVSLVPTFSAIAGKYKYIKKVLLKERIPIDLIVAWRSNDTNPFVGRFVRAHLEYLQKRQTSKIR